DPGGQERGRGVVKRRMVALRGAIQPAPLSLHRQGMALDEILDEAVMAQFIRRLVERIDGAIGEAEDEEGGEDGEKRPPTADRRAPFVIRCLSSVVHAHSATNSSMIRS